MEAKVQALKDKLLALPLPSFAKKLIEHWVSASFMRYLIIGGSTFALQILFLYLLSAITHLEKVQANFISTLMSMVFNFIMSNYWTFKAGNTNHGKKVGKYLLLGSVNYIFDTVLAFPFLSVTVGINPYLAKVFITGMIVLWNFFIYKFWVFRT